MLDATLEAALNDQMNLEFASAHLYLAMAAHMDARNLVGGATWMRTQAQEETDHAMWFITEQVEEERTVEQIAGSMELAGESGAALLILDRELGARTAQRDAAPA